MNVITKNIARGLISTMGTAEINKMAVAFIDDVILKKNEIALDDSECDVIGIIYEINKTAYFAQAAIRENQEGETVIVRYLNVTKITDLLETLLENI